MRRAAKVDANQAEIVTAFRRMGFTVHCLHAAGEGVPDLLLSRAGENYLIEVKDGSLPPSARQLTPAQKAWHADWRGQVDIIKSVDEAIEWAGSLNV